MSELEPDEELVDDGLDRRELVAILNGALATLDLVADFLAIEDEELAERLETAMQPIAEVLDDLGGEVYARNRLIGTTEAYLQ